MALTYSGTQTQAEVVSAELRNIKNEIREALKKAEQKVVGSADVQ